MQLFSDALEEWTELQRTWMRLEGVFGTPDFKRQMPEQSQQFGDVDKQFRAVVQQVRDKPAALQVRVPPARPFRRRTVSCIHLIWSCMMYRHG